MSATSVDVIEEHLLEVRPFQVLLELTGRCNLRCIYCAVSQPDYVHRDLELDRDEIVRQVVELAPAEFQISGHGETSLVKGWHELGRALQERGLSTTMISHLNKPMSEDEIHVLSRLDRLTVSCDTQDPALYQRLRRGGRLEKVAENIRRILQLCRRDGIPPTYIALNCTATHLNVAGIPELVAWGADLGVSAVMLTNLVEYPEIEGVEKPLHPSTVDPAGALQAIRRGAEVANARGIDYLPMGDLVAVLEEACRKQTG
jgi:MoaA/NifB/PqqE/SkfB family radical SAM enzyme